MGTCSLRVVQSRPQLQHASTRLFLSPNLTLKSVDTWNVFAQESSFGRTALDFAEEANMSGSHDRVIRLLGTWQARVAFSRVLKHASRFQRRTAVWSVVEWSSEASTQFRGPMQTRACIRSLHARDFFFFPKPTPRSLRLGGSPTDVAGMFWDGSGRQVRSAELFEWIYAWIQSEWVYTASSWSFCGPMTHMTVSCGLLTCPST